jgi:hypothetical protein
MGGKQINETLQLKKLSKFFFHTFRVRGGGRILPPFLMFKSKNIKALYRFHEF